jgi:hypothetical protein
MIFFAIYVTDGAKITGKRQFREFLTLSSVPSGANKK